MRKTLIIMLSFMMVFAMMPQAAADQHNEGLTTVEVIMEIGSTAYTVNGVPHTMDVAPYIEVGRTMVPVSFVARSFGLTSDFGPVDGLTEWVTFENEDLLIEIEIGSFDITVTEGGVSRTEVSDVAARIDNGRTYMPLRAVGEILGAEFDWGPRDAATEWVNFSLSVAGPVDPGELQAVAIELVADGFTSPLAYVPPNDGTGRMFVVDQIGLIRIVDANGNVMDENFIDLRDRLVTLRTGFDERGLLGLAFHPNFSSNGRFFVHYSAPLRPGGPEGWNHTAVISEFTVTEPDGNTADAASERILLQIDQPQFNHNGGHIMFGPDGYLLHSFPTRRSSDHRKSVV